jgi:hypothetical protein
MLDGVSLDAGALGEDLMAATKVDIDGREIVDALVVAAMVVVLDEGFDLGLEVAEQVVVFLADAVLQGSVSTLDLALCLGMARRAAHMVHPAVVEPFGQFARDVAGAIVAEQSGLVIPMGLIAA